MNAVTKILTQLAYIDRGGAVQRMHMIPVLQRQNVAAHSFGVAWWCWLLSSENPRANLLMAALSHDLAEGVVGDIPAPTKRLLEPGALDKMEHEADYHGGLPVFELTEEEVRILKLADCMDLLNYCIKETELGNRTPQLYEMFLNVSDYVREQCRKSQEIELLTLVSELYWKVRNDR